MTMQNTPLLMSRILGRGATLDPDVEVVTAQADGTHRQTLKQTWERAQHDQWCAYIMTEIEAHLWSSARNTFIYPEEERLEVIHAQNAKELKRAMGVPDSVFERTAKLLNLE